MTKLQILKQKVQQQIHDLKHSNTPRSYITQRLIEEELEKVIGFIEEIEQSST